MRELAGWVTLSMTIGSAGSAMLGMPSIPSSGPSAIETRYDPAATMRLSSQPRRASELAENRERR
jgi:hypothetical protein